MTNERYRVLKTWSDALSLVISDLSLEQFSLSDLDNCKTGIHYGGLFSLHLQAKNSSGISSCKKYCGCINVFTLLRIFRRYMYSLRVKTKLL